MLWKQGIISWYHRALCFESAVLVWDNPQDQVSKGIEIIENLRGHTSGFAVPTFVVDAPGGGGKIPVMPTYLISQGPNRVVLRNFEGVVTTYTEPTDYKDECHCEECEKRRKTEGVAELLSGERLSLEPVDLDRRSRNLKGIHL